MISRLPAFLFSLKGVGTSQQQASSPKRSLGLARRRYGSFCKWAAGWQPTF
jgi:hypothetical protein